MSRISLRIGLAGIGLHGARYAAHLLAGDIPRARLVAIHRQDQAAGRDWAARHGVAFAPSLEGLAAASDVDALVAALPPTLHPVAVAAAAAARKPILVEKPLGADPVAARRAVEAAELGGQPAMIALTLRFDRTVRALRRELHRVGAIHLIAINHRFEPTGRRWLDDPREGGVLLNTGVHGVDLMRHLTGAEIVAARGFGRGIVLRQLPDVFSAVLRLEPGGILASIDNSRATAGRTGRIEVVGEAGQLLADHVHGSLGFVERRRLTALQVPPPTPTVREALSAFTDAVLDATPVPIPLSEGLAAVDAVEMIRVSLAGEDR